MLPKAEDIVKDVESNFKRIFADEKISLSKKAMPVVKDLLKTLIKMNYQLKVIELALNLPKANKDENQNKEA